MKIGSLYSSFSSPYLSGSVSKNSGHRSTGVDNNFSELSFDRENISGRNRRNRVRRGSNSSIKSTKTMSKKRGFDFTNATYREAVGRLRFLLAESYTPSKPISRTTYKKHFREDSGEDTDNLSQVTDRPPLSDISKYLSSNSKRSARQKPASKSISPSRHYSSADYTTPRPVLQPDAPQAPTEIASFIQKQEDYIEQLEKESKYCRDELSSLLGKVRDVISENEALTEHARADLVGHVKLSGSSESEDNPYDKIIRSRKDRLSKSPSKPLSGPNIIFESRISELEAELAQANIDLKKLRNENTDLVRKSTLGLANDPTIDAYRKKIDNLERDKIHLEETVRKLQHSVEELRAEGNQVASKTQRSRDIADVAIFEKSQAEIEIRRLKDELERQHERVRELQHEMSRRLVEERSSAERRYNYQVEQLGGDLSCQWEQASKLQLELEREKRIESDLKREMSQKNLQIDELKQELKDKKVAFLSDLAQVNAEKQSLEQEITALRLQLDRAERQSKIEACRLNAEINSLRQRLDRADADIIHTKRENLRLSDEIANLEKDIALGEMKGEIRPTTKEINKTIMDLEQKHAGTVSDLEDMIQSQRQLMDKLTNECRSLTSKLEETTLKHNDEKTDLRQMNGMLLERLRQIWTSYKELNPSVSGVPSDTESLKQDDDRKRDSVEVLSITNHQKEQQQPQQSQQSIVEVHRPYPIQLQQQEQEVTHQSRQNLLHTTTIHQLMIVPSPDQHHQHQTFPTPIVPPTNTKMTMKRKKIGTKKNIRIRYEPKIGNPTKARHTVTLPLAINSSNPTPKSQLHSSHMPSSNTNQPTTTKPTINNSTVIQPTVEHTINPTTCPSTQVLNSNPTTSTNQPTLIRPINPKPIYTPTLNNPISEATIHQQSNQQQQPIQDSFHHQQAAQLHLSQHPQHQQFHQQSSLHQQIAILVASEAESKAQINRERAATLWGRQVPETAIEDHIFCRNSLPRQLNECRPHQHAISDEQDLRLGTDDIDPFDLIPEFDISSPSLFERSDDESDESNVTLNATIIHQQIS